MKTKENGLLPCKFERGQVWKNPDDKLMMIRDVEIYHDRVNQIYYVTEDGEYGFFLSTDSDITNNCELLCTQPPHNGVGELE